MSLDILNTVEIIEVLENFIDKIRPSEDIREQLDIAYKIENQSIIIHEIRPHVFRPGAKIEPNIAKATYVKAKDHWKIFCERSDLKWHLYKPCPIVKNVQEFVDIVKEDKHGCFWG
jgi:hypothetical protein